MEVFILLLLFAIIALLIWNIILFWKSKNRDSKADGYFELKARLNFIVAVGSVGLLIIAYLGFGVKNEILNKADPIIIQMVNEKSKEIDSLFSSKNILKAGIYIVNDIVYKSDSTYNFRDFKTIDNASLPLFKNAPKLMINSSTGNDFRVRSINSESFVLTESIPKYTFLGYDAEGYPDVVTLDIWIADYTGQ